MKTCPTDKPLFQIRCINGGHQGDHGVGEKVLKRFAFLTFQFARDAKIMLDLFEWGEPFFQSRRLKIHPGVIPGSWLWLKGSWICLSVVVLVDAHVKLYEKLRRTDWEKETALQSMFQRLTDEFGFAQ